MKRVAVVSLVVVLHFILNGCKKESENFSSASISDYFPLQVGKVYIYRLDSTVLAPFGTALVVKSYHAKDSIESTFTDNEGRLSYRIFRYITDTLQMQAWKFTATYVATPTSKNLEYVDNNMRFLKLSLPIIEGHFWYGHAFIDTKSNFQYLDDVGGSYWQYQYESLGKPYTLFNKTYDSTVIVAQNDETTPPGPFDPNNFQERNFGLEIYAKGIGMIYKEFLHWTWQTTPNRAYQDDSYGIKLRLIRHN